MTPCLSLVRVRLRIIIDIEDPCALEYDDDTMFIIGESQAQKIMIDIEDPCALEYDDDTMFIIGESQAQNNH